MPKRRHSDEPEPVQNEPWPTTRAALCDAIKAVTSRSHTPSLMYIPEGMRQYWVEGGDASVCAEELGTDVVAKFMDKQSLSLFGCVVIWDGPEFKVV